MSFSGYRSVTADSLYFTKTTRTASILMHHISIHTRHRAAATSICAKLNTTASYAWRRQAICMAVRTTDPSAPVRVALQKSARSNRHRVCDIRIANDSCDATYTCRYTCRSDCVIVRDGTTAYGSTAIHRVIHLTGRSDCSSRSFVTVGATNMRSIALFELSTCSGATPASNNINHCTITARCTGCCNNRKDQGCC